MQLKDAVAFVYRDSLVAGVANGADWQAAKVGETYDQDRDDVEIEEDADLPEMGNYFVSLEKE